MKKQTLKSLLKACLLTVLLATSIMSYAQDTQLVGRVSDAEGEFMIGVTIQEKGSSNAAITDMNGQYTLNLSTGNPVIIVSFIGYKTQEVKVGKSKVLDVVLEEDVSALDEVVVVGYGQQRKVSVVGAQSTLKMSEAKMPTANLSSAISGRIAGVVAVQRSGEPGHDDSEIWIRGISTFIGQNSQPLVLVDGIERKLNNIDPDDIESFTVLKDASATAVYGVRGANGVIIVKTKPGKVGKPQFNVDYYEGFITMTKKVKLANAYDYMDAANEAYADSYNGGVLYSPQYIEATQKAHGLLANDNLQMYNPYLYPAVDWMKELFDDWGRNRRANISVRGGSPNASYYVSLTYYGEDGLINNIKRENYNTGISFDRYNFVSNLNLRPTNKLAVDVGVSGYISEGNYPQQSTGDLFKSAMEINPVYMPLMMPDGSVSGISGLGDMRNPYADLARRGYKNEYRSTINTNLRVSQDLDFWNWSKGLKVNALIAFDNYTSRDLKYNKRESTYYFGGTKNTTTGLWNNDVFNEDGTYNMVRTYEGNEELKFEGGDTNSNRSFYVEASMNYDRMFGDHRVGALFLYNQKSYRNTTAGDLRGTLPYKQQGLAGRATYSWKDRYFAEFNIGYNGSENFSPGKRFGTFPAFGLGWAVSNEAFWAPIQKYVSYLKFRYTDGKVGSDAVADRRYMYLSEMNGNEGYRFGDGYNYIGGWGISKYGVNVGWSTSRKQDLGVDIKFLNDELSFTVDMFKERREGIFLQRKTVPSYAGWTEMPYGNLGIVENKGIEAAMEWNHQFGKKTFLSVRGNITWNEDKIIENDEPAQPYSWLEKRGTNVNGRWGLIAEGLFTSEEEIAKSATPPGTVKVGDIKYKDLNGDGIIDDYDKSLIGQGNVPKVYYGFGADLQIGQFSVSAIFQGQAKVDRCLSGNSIQPFSSINGIDNLYSNIGDRWSADDPTNQNVFYPRLHYGQSNNSNNNKVSTWWQKDMSYLRLKQLTIAYHLPESLISKIGLKSAKIYLMGTNVLTFSKFKLWDPELNTDNGTSYPNTSNYSLGVNFNF
ncbi:TonB-dependent receptor [Bacteroides sp. 519]|nr:TonB-dependent receptor [Bacteroides sp. 519]NDV58039.1 TonB-dependent receptor [Bacteroides sp. 519]